MGILSNFLGLREGRGGPVTPPVIRPAAEGEIEAALRLVLGGHGISVPDQQVQEFLAFARDREMDLSLLWVAEQDGRLTLAALPVPSPGRTMLLFASPASRQAEPTMSRVIDAACAAAGQRGVHLAQALIDPADDALRRTYEAAGFRAMAELIYLQGTPRGDVTEPPIAAPYHWQTYGPANHAKFAQVILDSYQDSLDCPALNGVRDVEDVIDGHKASGVFDPNLWLLLCADDRPVGVLLLSASGRNEDVIELVYLGLCPAARGRKLGELLIKQALATVVREEHKKLSLAVDARNVPALKLYYRHGMNRLTSKVAMMRDLREG